MFLSSFRSITPVILEVLYSKQKTLTKINHLKIQFVTHFQPIKYTFRIARHEYILYIHLIETKHRQLSEVSQRRTASRLLFNNMQIYSVNDLLRPLHVNVLYHRVRSGR